MLVERNAPINLNLVKCAPRKMFLERSAPINLNLVRSAPRKMFLEISAPINLKLVRSAPYLWREVLHVCGEKCITFVKRSASTTTIFAHCNKNFRSNLQIPSVNESANGIATDNSRLWREVRWWWKVHLHF